MAVEPTEDYDDIDILIDTDPIKLGVRFRAMRARHLRAMQVARNALDVIDGDEYSRSAFAHILNELEGI